MDELTKRLQAAPREAAPSHDLWHGVALRIRGARKRHWQRAAIAVLLFGAGTLAGTLLERNRAGSVGSPEGPSTSALHTAADVQRAGSDYLAAVARLRQLGPEEASLRTQGYETALGVVLVAAQEVTTALDLPDRRAFVTHARNAHAATAQRASTLSRMMAE